MTSSCFLMQYCEDVNLKSEGFLYEKQIPSSLRSDC